MKATGVIAASVLLVLGFCMLGIGCNDGDGGMTQEKWSETVQMGMTAEEVNAAVGRPPDRAFNSVIYWRFGNDEGGVRYGNDGRVVGIRWLTGIYG